MVFGCFSFRSGKLLLTEFPVNRIVGSLGPSATIPIRACLRARQLDRVVVRPAGAKVIPEPAEPLPLLRVGPDHQMIPTADSSGIDIATPDLFLESAVSHAELDRQVAELLIGSMSPIQFYSSFINFSVKDTPVAERLYADLQSQDVRCWHTPEDLKIGEMIPVGIDRSIRVHDKLLLILSKNSLGSEWVEKEVETAMERERTEKRIVLFPVRIDDAVMQIENGWPADIRRSRNIGDF
jgi:hypothetical protein